MEECLSLVSGKAQKAAQIVKVSLELAVVAAGDQAAASAARQHAFKE